MYLHAKCKGFILATRTITLSSGLVVTKDGIQIIGTGNIKDSNSKGKISLYCTQCSEVIATPEDIISRCMECGNEFRTPDLYLISNAGGIFCGECARENFPNNRRLILSKLISDSLETE